MGYADYHARCWAESKSDREIQAEIDRLKHWYPTRQWNEVGCAHFDYVREVTLRELLAARKDTES